MIEDESATSQWARKTLMARLATPTSQTPTRIGVLADPHLAIEATGTWKCYHRTETFFCRAITGVQASEPDAVIVAGDLTKDGEARNFERYDELAAPLSDPITIPGNHDVPKESTEHKTMSIDAFADRYTESGYPFRKRVGSIDFLCLNSATMPNNSLEDSWGGQVSADQLAWLDDELDRVSTPVVVFHHNLFAQPEHSSEFGGNFSLANRHQLRAVLSNHGPALIISGHHHIPSVNHEAGLTEVIAPALCSYPPSYLVFDIGPTGTTVHRILVATQRELAESYTLGQTGSEFGRRIVDIAADRIGTEPYQAAQKQ